MSQALPLFIHAKELGQYSYPPDAIFDTRRAEKARELLLSLGLLGGTCGRQAVAVPASVSQLKRFHSARYLDALQQATDGKLTDEQRHMGLGSPDCPVFPDMFDYAAWASGATLVGAEKILSGETHIAFNPSGGFHHAGKEKASGFCYVNDLALACLRFTEKGKRVLYLDIDAHHGDGMQEAFYSSSDVMTISLHESGQTLWPWTGFENEIGQGAGKGFNVNAPLPIGICDEAYLEVFNKIVMPLADAYNPDIFVLQLGMDALAGDLLAHLELTNNAHAEIIQKILDFNKPVLATGGGGYHVDNTVRGWALAWTVMCGLNLENNLDFGMGGAMLQNTDWAGGLHDRVLPKDATHCKSVEAVTHKTIQALIQNVFPYHDVH